MATLGKAEEILVGAASLYMGNSPGSTDDITAKPAFIPTESYRTTLEASPWSPTSTDPTLVTTWRPLGYTQEGLEVSYEPDFGDVEVDQVLDSVAVFKQSMKVSLNTTLAQATLYNLMVAWGQSASTLTSGASHAEIDIASGELGDAPVERPIIAVGNGVLRNGVQYGERVYHAYRTLNVESSSHSMKRNENTGIPVSLRALPANNGLYGKIRDRKRAW